MLKHGVYVGVGDKAKQVKALYIGVDGVAKKVVKAYIGVDGKAKQVWPAKTDSATITFVNCPGSTAITATYGSQRKTRTGPGVLEVGVGTWKVVGKASYTCTTTVKITAGGQSVTLGWPFGQIS